MEQMTALIKASEFCSQWVEYECKNSKLLGDGGYINGSSDRLKYFPGGDGVADSCACGATKSCAKADVKCNCNIMDGVARKDMGLVLNKQDMPVTMVVRGQKDSGSGNYTVGSVQCAGLQFGIEPNCEKYRTIDVKDDYSYFVDPDGPGNLAPFLVECKFTASPPLGKTIVHHTEEGEISQTTSNWLIEYLRASPEQITALKTRSTFCSQEVKFGCQKFSISIGDEDITWEGTNNKLNDMIESLNETCGGDVAQCNCKAGADGTDTGEIKNKDELPVKSMSFGTLISQLASGSKLAASLGPLVCAEVFPTCRDLKRFFDTGKGVKGESKVNDGLFTIDPDGLGGVEPFMVTCKFPETAVEIKPTTDGVNVKPDNPNGMSKCYDINYSSQDGTPITPEQITALVRSSKDCTQQLRLNCQNTPATAHVNFTTCDGITQPGWAGSFGEDKCACGVSGVCDGGPQHKCNCDLADNVLRTDRGDIVDLNRLPICQVCLDIPPFSVNMTGKEPPKTLSFSVGQLKCNPRVSGVAGGTCQAAIKNQRVSKTTEAAMNVNFKNPTTVGCRFHANGVGEMLVKPKPPQKPKPGEEVDITIDYYTYQLTTLKKEIESQAHCTQIIFAFCLEDGPVVMGGKNMWYSVDGAPQTTWEELAAGDARLTKACADYPAECALCKPRGFKISEKKLLPVTRVSFDIPQSKRVNISIVPGELICQNAMKSCQDIIDTDPKKTIGNVGRNIYVIDPDGAGDLFPYPVKCFFKYNHGPPQGITQVDVKGYWTKSRTIKGNTRPAQTEKEVEYKDATHEQLAALTKVSEFCVQNLVYRCENSPLLRDGDPAAGYALYGKGNVTSFGTDEDVDFPGCACAKLGTCEEGVKCNCDVVGTMPRVDQGAVTNRAALPITKFYVGEQPTGKSKANVKVTRLRCTRVPSDPPTTCGDAKKNNYWHKRDNDIDFSRTGDYLITPDKLNPKIKPFMAHCDYDLVPGVGVTVIKTKYPEGKPIDKQPNLPNTETVKYYGPSEEQIRALINKSKFCYQGVRFDCKATPLFSKGSYWTTTDSLTRNTFWGGGQPGGQGSEGTCACGKVLKCGGNDTNMAQIKRSCNCDVGDNEFRADAGFITEKSMLPVKAFTFAAGTPFGKVNLTIGDLYCADEELHLNECQLGFHDCHEHADCEDKEEGFDCFCRKGWQAKGRITYTSPKANGRECIDDNECSWSPCPYEATCINEPGSFRCECNKGFRQIGKMECEDINECKEGKHKCHADAVCENLYGSHRCRCGAGFRGDGEKECIAVGQCACFGDPHCLSFDQRWVHFMGECEYVLSQDGCGNGTNNTFKVTADYWKQGTSRKGYFSWIKSVSVYTVGYNVTMGQNLVTEVNGIKVRSFTDSHLISVMPYGRKMLVKTVTGLEVYWDGVDAVDILVHQNNGKGLCGICGNYNAELKDDWTIGPACPETSGVITDNFDLFGRSWVVQDSHHQCEVDCKPTVVNPEIFCSVPRSLVQQECRKLLDLQIGPFKDCLKVKTDDMLQNLLYSCVIDGCLNEMDLHAQICLFAGTINDHCSLYENIKIDNWRSNVDACVEPECENNMVHLSCGPMKPPSCLTENDAMAGAPVGDVCEDGCFCPEGLLMEGTKCLKPNECGCFHNNQYIAAGESIVLSACTGEVKCKGGNVTTVSQVECGENEVCSIEGGIRGCHCLKNLTVGFIRNEETGKCEPDLCHLVECVEPNTKCKNGTCECITGSYKDCALCKDIDECATNQHTCHKLGQKCVNTPGSFECRCREGFSPAGKGRCQDIDECKYDLVNCGGHAECINTLGSYRCECCAGYSKGGSGKCVRDRSAAAGGPPNAAKCCACTHPTKCDEDGKVCGTDGNTYNSYRSLAIAACKSGKLDLKVNYKGQCKGDCSMVDCEKQYGSCEMGEGGVPKCGCPSCANVTNTHVDDLVCATNKITYISICHMKKDACEAEYETEVVVEIEGKPCPGVGVGGEMPKPGPWSDWGNCSSDCAQGVMNRTRDANGLSVHTEETKPCYSTCSEGPCTQYTCSKPGQVCTADEQNVTDCTCPLCDDVPKQPVCTRVGNVIQTYDNECELDREACENEQEDYMILENNACEVKPKFCGRVRNFQVYKDDDGCEADRSVDMGFCYGECEKEEGEGELCCVGSGNKDTAVILYCPDGTSKSHNVESITKCDCETKEEVTAPKMQVVGGDF